MPTWMALWDRSSEVSAVRRSTSSGTSLKPQAPRSRAWDRCAGGAPCDGLSWVHQHSLAAPCRRVTLLLPWQKEVC